jgi:hypothetical protein
LPALRGASDDNYGEVGHRCSASSVDLFVWIC